MILLWMLLIPSLGGLVAWAMGRVSDSCSRWVALLSVSAYLGFALQLWSLGRIDVPYPGCWRAIVDVAWIPQLGIRFHLMADGIGTLLLLLTGVVGVLAVGVSWLDITRNVGFFHLNLLWTVAGITGVFISMDLILLYCFWELMLVPLYFLIALWGRERSLYSAIKFFIYTQAGSLLFLVGILGLCFAHYRNAGSLTFNYFDLLNEPVSHAVGFWLMLAFFVGFAVKLPVVIVHGWLPDAHSQAPTAGSVFLAGLALKVGAYGMLRFAIPLFPEASADFAPVAMALGVAGILYGAVQAYGQSDLKRLIAYTSVSHMGFVLLGVYSWNELALQGAMVVILAHGVSAAALFAVAGMVHHRLGTYELSRMGGLWSRMPRLGGVTMLLAMASLGLPGLANFIGEFLVLLGAWKVSHVLTAIAATGLLLSVVYSLKIIQAVFHGPAADASSGIHDADPRELAMLVGCAAILLWIGVHPGPVLRTSAPAVRELMETTFNRQHPAANVQRKDVIRNSGRKSLNCSNSGWEGSGFDDMTK